MFVVDRIENGIVVVEFNDSYLEIPLESFSEHVSEGDVLYLAVDRNKTNQRTNNVKDKLNKLFNKSKN